jgi:hypothetical protein
MQAGILAAGPSFVFTGFRRCAYERRTLQLLHRGHWLLVLSGTCTLNRPVCILAAALCLIVTYRRTNTVLFKRVRRFRLLRRKVLMSTVTLPGDELHESLRTDAACILRVAENGYMLRLLIVKLVPQLSTQRQSVGGNVSRRRGP